ncbi:glycosyltransferase family 2 protein [Mycolicibacterium sp.]|uniref:glycosyltransferase family 2 protein n=1 Tax=Mycolicibacterium sp. TaxID=2320850 RepID=UPI001A316E39|nr:glycosyltransferase family 2 protein [Mycolicibacterium sp.]MBJ7339232.1 glycosyltransferase family 2 protein [Mycolicibacterium sp.]
MTDVDGGISHDVAPTESDAERHVLGPDGRPLIGANGEPIIDRRRPTSERRPRDPRVSVVVPAKNEAQNIREILPYLADFHEVIVVVSEDDHDSADAARTSLPSAKVIHQTRKGKGNALACGFAQVTGDAIVMFDVDGSADPHEIPRFVKALTDGADLAKGSRFCPGGGSQDITLLRAWGNTGLNMLASVLTNTRFTDLCYGYNAFWTDQLYMLDLPKVEVEDAPEMLRGDGFEIEALIIGRFALSGAAITEVPSFEFDRYHGRTNLNTFRDGFRVLWTILQDRRYAREIRKLSKRRHASNMAMPKRPGWMKDDPANHGVRRVKRLGLSEGVVNHHPWQTHSH